MAILFDDLNSNKNDLAEARKAAVRFVHEGLGTDDHIALFTTSSTVSLGFTGDRAALAAALAHIAPHPRSNPRGYTACPRISTFQAYLIAAIHDPVATRAAEAEAITCATGDLNPPLPRLNNLWSDADGVHEQARATWEMARGQSQATLAAIGDVVRYTAQQPGKRMVLLASGGFLSGSLEGLLDDIVRAALKSDVVINALDAKGLYADAPGRPPDESSEGTLPLASFFFEETSRLTRQWEEGSAMANLAVSTGGLLFENNNDLTLGFERLGLAPAVSYELAFSPQHLVHDGKLHSLKVELEPAIPGATVEARRGYFAPAPGPTAGELAAGLDQAMRGSGEPRGVDATVTVGEEVGSLAVTVHVVVVRPQERYTMLAGLFDGRGRFITGERGTLTLQLSKATYKRDRGHPLSPVFQLRAPGGAYRLRVVVQQASDGKLTALSLPVRIR